jgi:hypothetical protein
MLKRWLVELLEVRGGFEAGVEIILKVGTEINLVEWVFFFPRLFARNLFNRTVAVAFLPMQFVNGRRGFLKLFQNGVLDHLRVDHVLQLELVQREHADHLNQPGRKHLALGDLEVQFWLKQHSRRTSLHTAGACQGKHSQVVWTSVYTPAQAHAGSMGMER